MRRFLTIALAVGALSALPASGAFAAGKNPPTSCGVGGGVSLFTQEVGGIGKPPMKVKRILVKAIKAFHEGINEIC